MSLIERIQEKAKKNIKRIALPEGDEPRTVAAAARVKAEGLAEPVLIGNPQAVFAAAREIGADVGGIGIVDPAGSPKAGEYAAARFEMRRAKGVTEAEAARLVRDNMYFGIMMVRQGDADGLVSGAPSPA